MQLHFIRRGACLYEVEVRARRCGPDLRGPLAEAGADLPHDLVHAVLEQGMAWRPGLWSLVDAGVVFQGFRPLQALRHPRAGQRLLRRHAEPAQQTELQVSWAHRVWSGQRSQGRGLGTPPLAPQALLRCGRLLDAAWQRWTALADGEGLLMNWKGELGCE